MRPALSIAGSLGWTRPRHAACTRTPLLNRSRPMHESEQSQNFPDQAAMDARLDGLEEDGPLSSEKRRRKKASAVRNSAGTEPNPYDRMALEPPESFGEVQ